MDSKETVDASTLAEIERMVRLASEEFEVVSATPVDAGYNDSYQLHVRSAKAPRTCVLKTNVGPPEWLRVEARLYTLLKHATTIPVPTVYGSIDDHPDLPTPFILMEHIAGAHPPANPNDICDAALIYLGRQFGRYLGELHALESIDAFGPVRAFVDATDPGGTSGQVRAAGLTVDQPQEEWRRWLQAFTRDRLAEHAETRFSDLTARIRAAIDARTARMTDSSTPVLGRIDHAGGNVLVDPTTMEITGLIDWDMVHTVHAEYDLVCAEQSLSGTASFDDEARVNVRQALHEGYAETNQVEMDRDLRRLYLLANLVVRQLWLSAWVPSSEAEAIEQRHRELILELL